MADSVGKISLDLDLKSDLSKQINSVATKMGAQLTKSLQAKLNTATKGFNASKLTNAMGDALKKSMEDSMKPIANAVEDSLSLVEERIKKSINTTHEMMKQSIEENKTNALSAVDMISERLGKLKMPLLFDRLLPKKPMEETLPRQEYTAPKVNVPSTKTSSVDYESIKAQIASLEPVLNNVNGRLEHQQRKLADLKESYNNTFSEARKNKLEGQILSTEAAILRLTNQSDTTAQKIWKLEDSLDKTGIAADKTGQKVNTLGGKLKRSSGSFNTAERSAKKTGNAFMRAGQGAANMGTSFQRAITRILKQVFVFAIIYKAIRGLNSYMGSALKTNDQFMHSLNQVKTNLQVAFMPIYQAILPALQTLMNWLATATAYIAAFISAIFGKTYKQSFQAAQGLNAAKAAMGGYGSAAKKAGKNAKEANKQLGDLAGFDEINTLSQDKGVPDAGDAGGAGGGAGAGGAGMAPMIMPDIDTSVLDKKMAALRDKLKKLFKPTTDSLKNLWKAMDPFKKFVAKGAVDFYNQFLKPVGKWVFGTGLPRFIDAIAVGFQSINWSKINDGLSAIWKAITPFAINVGEGLLWFWENALVPIAAWRVNKSVPVYLELIATALSILGDILTAIAPAVKFMFNYLLIPLASWRAKTTIFWLNAIGAVLKEIKKWTSDPKKAWNDFKTSAAKNWTAIGKSVKDSVTGAKDTALKKSKELITGMTTRWNDGVKNTKEKFNLVKSAASASIEATRKYVVDKAKDAVIGMIGRWTTAAADTKTKFNTLKNSAASIFNSARTSLANTANKIRTAITTPISNARTSITNTISNLRTSASNHFNNLRTALVNTASNIRTRVTTPFTNMRNSVINAFLNIRSRMSGIWSGIYSTIRTYINRIISGINRMISGMNRMSFKVPNWVPEYGSRSFGISIPRIPMLAKGGIVDQPTLAMVGEAGKEAVMPLENNTGWINNLAGQIAGQMGGGVSQDSDLLQRIIDILLRILDALLSNDTEAIFKIGETEFGRASIRAINKVQRQAGKTLLNN